jgi:putative ABC transport system ATP-binding protein
MTPHPIEPTGDRAEADSGQGKELAVVCQGVTKAFGDENTRVWALRGIDAEIFAGELTLLVGPSGCGKTTLISIIAGLLEPTQGEVQVFGRSLPKMSAKEKVEFRGRTIGFVFQQYNLLPALTAAENAAVPLLIARQDRRRSIEKGRQMLVAMGIPEKANKVPAQLSGGQQQRVAIARALIHEPKLLVCDEPTAALDAESGQRVMELLRRVAVQSDRAVIVVSHDDRVYRYGDRILSMEDGRLVRTQRQPAPSV